MANDTNTEARTAAAGPPSAAQEKGPVSPELFWDAAWGFQKTAAIKAAVELDVFSRIGAGAGDLTSLAEQTGTAPRGLRDCGRGLPNE